MGKVEKVFITVKTYPTLSTKYDELVCTAGIREDGSWIRIYPLPFRKLDYEKRYRKYQWLEIPLKRNTADVRPESYKVTDIDRVRLLDFVEAEGNWKERKRIIFKKGPVFTNLKELIQRANDNELSLAIFKPSRIIDFVVEEDERDWPKNKIAILTAKSKQLTLFQSPEDVQEEFSHVDKLPYKFSYRFSDDQGRESTLMIEDWEIGMLYWNCLKAAGGDERIALKNVRAKYFDTFVEKKDLYLFLGTTKQFHGWAKNPFVIIGVFYPPIQRQKRTQQQMFNFDGQ